MELKVDEGIIIRKFREEDALSLAKYANNRKIWKNLRNTFPSPYTKEDALDWIRLNQKMKQPISFALVLNNECIGSVGFRPRSDVYIKSQELGYWLGEPFWGKGIMSKAVKFMADRALERFDIVRLEAHVYSWNLGSMRVVEKAGFYREAVLKQRIFKDGEIGDEHIFVRFK